MDGDRFCAVRCEVAGDQAAEIFGAAGNDDGFPFDRMIGHERALLGKWDGTVPPFLKQIYRLEFADKAV
ncbi:hypothetical protein Rhsp01_18620 [Rhizobium sp. NBRC 114257]|uniref:ASCH domain-containing protein n=1 Tax=Rhizobium dioscoreae TaxID=2653122 RepID=A0ABQ0Z164_9HYPH|nr:hypothetical protein RsS93_18580 [Rhizobium dioscoreae]GLU80686.1 hypothetical protein Rhsp01_18620 [Rhizobium sp. NBRC 114257]